MTATTTTRPTDGAHLPVIHGNGSGKQALLDQYDAACHALDAALAALADMAPNGRDYYPKGDGAIRLAEAEFRRRCTLVESVKNDIMADWMAVLDGSAS